MINKLLNDIIKLELKLSLKESRSNQDILVHLLDQDFFEFGTSGNIFKRQYTIDKLIESGADDNIESFDFSGRLLSNDIYQLTYKTKK